MSVVQMSSAVPAASAPAPQQVFQYDLTKTFGIPTPKPVMVPGGNPQAANPFTPVKDPIYVFIRDLIRVLAAWWTVPAGNEGMLLFGPTQAGKTTLVKNFFARLNVPLVVIPCGKNTKLEDYLFQPVFSNEGGFSMRYEEGPLTQAVRNGWVVCLDEVDRLPAKESTRLHELLGGAPLLVPQLSDKPIPRSKNVRFCATANTNLRGDESGLYAGAQKQDGAFLQRWVYMKVGYMAADVEKALVKSKYPDLQDVVIDVLVELANATRSAFVDGGGDGSEQLGVVLSTRKVLETAHYLRILKDDKEPFMPALDLCLLASASPAERDAIVRMLRMVVNKPASP